MRPIFYNLSSTIARIFRGYNLLWQLLAFFLTYALVMSGFDWRWAVSSQEATLQAVLFPAVIIGGIVPIILPIVLLLFGNSRKDKKLLNTGFAVTQAAALGLVISSTYKAFTGRVAPPFHHMVMPEYVLGTDTSHLFDFGFFREGVFWGWPSSHTSVAFAVAMALVCLYPRNKWIKYLAPLSALYVGVGVSVSIHWFSDFIAGAILGTVIGLVVGKSFCERIKVSEPH